MEIIKASFVYAHGASVSVNGNRAMFFKDGMPPFTVVPRFLTFVRDNIKINGKIRRL
jgi:hypothetical protein